MIARDPRDVELDRAVLAASLAESIDPAMLLGGFGIVDAIHREETQDFVVAVSSFAAAWRCLPAALRDRLMTAHTARRLRTADAILKSPRPR